MKNTINILGLILLTKIASAQAGVPDTIAYLNSIAANKVFFTGKPFSVLADSLKIKIKYFSPYAHFHYNASWETSTIFSFYFPQDEHEIYLTYPQLEIYWKPYLDMDQANSLFYQSRGSWPSAIAAHYAIGIIADIKIRE